MTLTEFNEEVYNKLLYEDGVEDGIKIGKSEGVIMAFGQMYKTGKITLSDAASGTGLSESEFVQKCEELSINQ